MAPGWALPAVTLLAGLFSARGNGGGSEFSDEQKRLYGTQADIADMMADLYQSRIANEERYLGGAMDRVFGYVDDSLGRNPDLLYAPGIFEFMPRGARGPEVPRPAWEPYVPGQTTVTPDPPPPEEFPPFEHPAMDLPGLTPVTEVVPPVDVAAFHPLLNRVLGPFHPLLNRGGPQTLEEALDLGEEEEYGSWFDQFKEEYDDFFDNLPTHLRTAEDTVRDALDVDTKPTAEQREAFNMGANIGRYNPEDLFTWGTRDVSSETFAPPGEYDPGITPVSVDSVTGEVKGPVVPPGATPLDLPVEDFVRAHQARIAGALPITGLIPGVQPMPGDRVRRDEEETAQQIEQGEYWPEVGKGSVPIRQITATDLLTLERDPRNFQFELVNQDGSSISAAEYEAFIAGEPIQPVYVKGVHTGRAKGPGWGPGDVDYSEIQYLTAAQLSGLLGPVPGGALKHGPGGREGGGEAEEVAEAETPPTTRTPRPDGRVERPGPRYRR